MYLRLGPGKDADRSPKRSLRPACPDIPREHRTVAALVAAGGAFQGQPAPLPILRRPEIIKVLMACAPRHRPSIGFAFLHACHGPPDGAPPAETWQYSGAMPACRSLRAVGYAPKHVAADAIPSRLARGIGNHAPILAPTPPPPPPMPWPPLGPEFFHTATVGSGP